MDIDSWRKGGAYFDWGGQPVFYRADGAGPWLLCLHGFPTASWDWHRLWPELTSTRRVLAADFLGYGYSAKPRAFDYSVVQQTDMILALLAHRGITEVDVLAHDFGDSVAQELVARAPLTALKLRSVCYLNGGLFMEAARPRLIQRLLLGPIGPWLSARIDYRRFARSFAAIFGPDTQPSEQDLREFWALVAHADGHHIAHRLIRYIPERHRQRARWVAAMRAASVPQMLIIGMADPVSGWRIARRWRELLPECPVVELARIGHYPQVEAPDAVLAAWQGFVG